MTRNSSIQKYVCNVCNNKYLNPQPISKPTVIKIEKKFRGTGLVKDLLKGSKKPISKNKKLVILLAIEENPHT